MLRIIIKTKTFVKSHPLKRDLNYTYWALYIIVIKE